MSALLVLVLAMYCRQGSEYSLVAAASWFSCVPPAARTSTHELPWAHTTGELLREGVEKQEARVN